MSKIRANIFYFRHINSIGGIESFFWYLSKKYKDLDITVYYKTGDENQIKRLAQNIRVRRFCGETIKCKKAFFCFNLDIIDNVEAEEYIQVCHGDYKAMGISLPSHPKITRYIGVSKNTCDTFKEISGKDIELSYNPISIDKPKRVLKLISTTRLTKEKGKSRMIKLAELLEKNDIPYIWLVFTDDRLEIDNPNIVYMKPRLDIGKFISVSDYLVQLSDNEGYCFSVVESLILGTPVIVTDCPVFRELGCTPKNSFILDFELDYVPINEIYKGLPKFTYKPKKDSWDKYLVKRRSTYQEDLKTIVMVRCIRAYYDLIEKRHIRVNEEFKTNKLRAEYLEELKIVKKLDNE